MKGSKKNRRQKEKKKKKTASYSDKFGGIHFVSQSVVVVLSVEIELQVID